MKQKIKKHLNRQRRKKRDIKALRDHANLQDKLADQDYRNHISPLCIVIDYVEEK